MSSSEPPRFRLLLKYPNIRSASVIIPKSSLFEFKGAPKFLTIPLTLPLVRSVLIVNISKSPSPGRPSEEKYKLPPSSMKGNISFPIVFTLPPKFSGFDQTPFINLDIYISVPPYPPGISETKYKKLSFEFTDG